ncbi:hypothetical protein F0L68_38025 [Solihabitans fulvus]|uniref:Uncharacterized protein n=1 Tax=Solihabitans fulvus TaxID=1892852 RepID=A0A5B2WJZ1_9PSEU|nr:hypothetical protein [Solihabitans fulvus]KAA2251224.1 hypothetical protein F0L68_38025 [Solihabitans fulvus]
MAEVVGAGRRRGGGVTPRSVWVVMVAAVVLTAAGLATAASLRPRSASTEAAPPTSASQAATSANVALQCGSGPCQTVAGQNVGADRVEVLIGGSTGRIRVSGPGGTNIFEATTIESGAKLASDSLQCVEGVVSVCLVHGRITGGKQDGGMAGEVLVRRSGSWARGQVPYYASAPYLALRNVDDGVVDVVAAQASCAQGGGDCQRFYAQVFSVVRPAGAAATPSCTAVVTRLTALPGWPTVAPDPAKLRKCPN